MARTVNNCWRYGFALIEAVTASLVLGLLAAATLSAVSASSSARLMTADRARARQLAGDLAAEISAQAYAEAGSNSLGPDAGESGAASRLAFDDVDDYAGLSESPPTQRDGTKTAGLEGWTRTTSVSWVSAADIRSLSLSESSAKLITVSVKKGNRVLGKVSVVRTAAMDAALWTGKTMKGQTTVSAVAPPGG